MDAIRGLLPAAPSDVQNYTVSLPLLYHFSFAGRALALAKPVHRSSRLARTQDYCLREAILAQVWRTARKRARAARGRHERSPTLHEPTRMDAQKKSLK